MSRSPVPIPSSSGPVRMRRRWSLRASPGIHSEQGQAREPIERTKGGCLTCRVRKKKCSSSSSEGQDPPRGPCELCQSLHLQCLGFQRKFPVWMTNEVKDIIRERCRDFHYGKIDNDELVFQDLYEDTDWSPVFGTQSTEGEELDDAEASEQDHTPFESSRRDSVTSLGHTSSYESMASLSPLSIHSPYPPQQLRHSPFENLQSGTINVNLPIALLQTIAQSADSTAVFEATNELTMRAMLQAGFSLPFPNAQLSRVPDPDSHSQLTTPAASTSAGFVLDPQLQHQIHDANYDLSPFLNLPPSTPGEEPHHDTLKGTGETDVAWPVEFEGSSHSQ